MNDNEIRAQNLYSVVIATLYGGGVAVIDVKIQLIETHQEPTVVFNVHTITNRIQQIINLLRQEEEYVFGVRDRENRKIFLHEIYYFEGTKEKVRVFCENDFYELKDDEANLKILEDRYCGMAFFRISKWVLVNTDHIFSFTALPNRNFSVTLKNGKSVEVSRSYTKEFEKQYGGGD